VSDLNLCKNHKQEWKHSEYSEGNCDYCKIEKELQTTKQALEVATDALEKLCTIHNKSRIDKVKAEIAKILGERDE